MSPEPPRPSRVTARIGAVLNLALLALVLYGYGESERWRTAWLLAATPVAAAVLAFGWHLFKQE